MHVERYLWIFFIFFYQSYHCSGNLKINYFFITTIQNFFTFSQVTGLLSMNLKASRKGYSTMGTNPFQCWNLYKLRQKYSPVVTSELLKRNFSSTEVKGNASFDVSGDRITSWCLPPWMLILTLRKKTYLPVSSKQNFAVFIICWLLSKTVLLLSANSDCI